MIFPELNNRFYLWHFTNTQKAIIKRSGTEHFSNYGRQIKTTTSQRCSRCFANRWDAHDVPNTLQQPWTTSTPLRWDLTPESAQTWRHGSLPAPPPHSRPFFRIPRPQQAPHTKRHLATSLPRYGFQAVTVSPLLKLGPLQIRRSTCTMGDSRLPRIPRRE